MQALPIVIDFDVLEYLRTRLLPCDEAFAVDCFNLEAVVPGLSSRIVIAVAFFAHAAQQLSTPQQTLISERAILTASIRMHDHALWHLASPQGHG
jgi:hypothetical protein